MASIPSRSNRVVLTYEPRGAALRLFTCRDDEVVLSGPADTGKTRAALEKVHLCACKYKGSRHLLARKTLASLTASALVTFTRRVLHPLDGVRFFGGSAEKPPSFHYPNGSEVVVGGLDKASKIMSSEYDTIYVNEATELLEGDWETITTRLRNGVMPYGQLTADCNPGPPTHWLKRRADSGVTTMLESRHEDNPSITPERLARLDRLTGVRYLRLRKGIWAAAEGLVYDGWDPAIHLVDRFEVPPEWPRYWVVDFGYTNPFVWQQWAQDPDGRLYREREIYMTQRLVQDHAKTIAEVTAKDPRPQLVICDHDAEGRATLERHLGISTVPAFKSVSPGIEAVAARLRPAGDGRPRLFLLRDSLVERDPAREEAKRPAVTEEEFDGYVWDLRSGQKKGEQPLKEDDHGMDCVRYLAAQLDEGGRVSVDFV